MKMNERHEQEEDRSECRQPEEWEAILKDVTVPRDYREIPFDPQMLPFIQERYQMPELVNIADREEANLVLDRDVERLRRAIDRKLHGRMKICMLLSALTGWSNRRIAAVLGYSKDTVRRDLDEGVKILKTYFRESEERTFPRFHRSRKVLRAGIFPLDTDRERSVFQQFVNDNVILHLAYSGGDDFREAMVIYLPSAPAEKSGVQQ